MGLPSRIAAMVEALIRAVEEEALSRDSRLELARTVHRAIVPRRKPGRKRDQLIDRAYEDYKAGNRGLQFYSKYIPDHSAMSRWRRRGEETQLRKNCEKRAEREKKRQQATNPPSESSPRRSAAEDCRPDI